MSPHPLAHWFTHTRFALKFGILGLAVAGPLLVLSGYAVASLHARVQQLQAVERALDRADHIRTLAISIARHRGLSASVLAGGEDVSSQLVAEQDFMLPQLDKVVALMATGEAGTALLPDAPGLQRELKLLTQLPQGLTPADNFQRHSAVINALLSASARLGQGLAQAAEQATDNDTVFVRLPMLIEELGRQRGWGSAILTLQQADPAALQAYLLHAGAVARGLEVIRADPATLARLDRLHGGLGQPLQEVLALANAFWARSLATVQAPPADDSAGRRHFADGTAVIDQMAAVNETLVAAQHLQTQAALSEARHLRAGAVAGLLAVLLFLLWLYREFARTTVQRLQALGAAARHLAQRGFDEPIQVAGSDEIAELGQAMDAARVLLRAAVAQHAAGLAAQQADRAKTEFMARWSHDLRTPLNAVLGFAELIESRPGARLSEAQRADLQQIRQAGAHLLQLVNDVLDITRLDASRIELQMASHSLRDAVADALALLQTEADAAAVAVHLDTSDVASGDRVLADRTRLLQILAHLLGNAIKHNRPGGRVDVRLRGEGERLCVEVQDSGPGIALADQAQVFQAFAPLGMPADGETRHPRGLGLGLALSRRLAQLMGGDIHLHSVPGQGSTFTLCLARAPARAAKTPLSPPAPAGSRPALPVSLPPGQVAYVEDDPVNVLLVREMLAGVPGLALSVYTTAEEALAAAQAGARFDLWLVDRHLPDSDGVALLQHLNALAQARGEAAPRAVMLSADAMPSSMAPALAAGFLDYWTKPVALHSLREGVATQLGRARAEAAAAGRAPGLATIGGTGEPPT